ncbi:MAG: hypothetical protein ACREQI_00855 [Candidatus Binataceae bacterium]
MEENGTLTFREPIRWTLVTFVIPGLLPLFLFPPRHPIEAAFYLIWLALVVALARHYLLTVKVRPDGLKLFGRVRLPWNDVRRVELCHSLMFHFPYFRVTRHTGHRISMPLHYVGESDLGHAIMNAAPPGNPFRSVSIPS